MERILTMHSEECATEEDVERQANNIVLRKYDGLLHKLCDFMIIVEHLVVREEIVFVRIDT